MKKIILVLIFVVSLSCRDKGPQIITAKQIDPPIYEMSTGKGSIKLDSLDYVKNKKLGNRVYMLKKRYVLRINGKRKVVSKYVWDNAKEGEEYKGK